MFSLTCPVQNYAWGRIGEDSIIAQLKTVSDPIFRTGATTPYAELWMGTHVSGPAKLMDGSLLLDWLHGNPSAVGQVPPGYPADDLPFLFKILSIRTALSIQSHPDKSLAAELFATRPDIYKDPNHKPEMAIALTPFEAMCGFRPISEIQGYLHSNPELGDMVGGADVLDSISDTSSPEEKKAALKVLFRKFMDCSDDIANAQISRVVQRLSSVSPSGSDDEIFVHDLVLRLNKDFPNDRGIFCPMILNCLKLSPGQGFFMGANEPHAYISGDCVECMALSDNVIRAALTPKYKDVDTLCDSLHYRCGKCEGFLNPMHIDEFTSLLRPPASVCSEFEVETTVLPSGLGSYEILSVPCGSILLFLRGDARLTLDETTLDVKPGSIIFTASGAKVIVTSSDGKEVLFYRAHANLA